MSKQKDSLYSARWALTKAIESDDYGNVLDFAIDKIMQAKADYIAPPPDEEPERPSAVVVDQYPNIVKGDFDVKTHGQYRTKTGEAEGLVVHFTAGRYDADATLKYLSRQGLGCMVMDQFGNIIMAPNQYENPKLVAYHAGKSSWKGKTSVSYYFAGMEICCAGLLDSKGKAWYGEQIQAADVRKVEKKDNVAAGLYHKFLPAQEKALMDYCLMQLRLNPMFKIENVVGHDEVSPGRKTDPGGSLSMTMPEFRELLTKKAKELNLIQS